MHLLFHLDAVSRERVQLTPEGVALPRLGRGVSWCLITLQKTLKKKKMKVWTRYEFVVDHSSKHSEGNREEKGWDAATSVMASGPYVSTCLDRACAVQGYLAHKKQHPPLRPPYGPRHIPTVGTWGATVSYERGTPAGPPQDRNVRLGD